MDICTIDFEELEAPQPQEVPQPQATKVVALVDDLEELKSPQLKKRKLRKVAEVTALVIQGPNNVANFLAAQRRQGSKPMVPRVVNEHVAAKPLNIAPFTLGDVKLRKLYWDGV